MYSCAQLPATDLDSKSPEFTTMISIHKGATQHTVMTFRKKIPDTSINFRVELQPGHRGKTHLDFSASMEEEIRVSYSFYFLLKIVQTCSHTAQ